MSDRNPLACYDGRFLARVIAVAVAIVALGLLRRALHLEAGTPLRLVFGGIEAVLFGYAIWITVFSIRRLDELQYRIQLEALAFAFAASAVTIVAWGSMTKAGWPPIRWGADTWIVMLLFWAVGLLLARRRYR